MLDGPFKLRQDIHGQYLEAVEPDRLLAPFRMQAGLSPRAERYGGWESRDIGGHSLGHYLSALCYFQAGTGHAKLVSRIDYIVDELAECQRANGDGYVLPVRKEAFEELRSGKMEVSPFSLNGVWVPFYTLHKVLAGLRDAYRLAGNKRGLEVARGVADWLEKLLASLSETQIQEMLRAEHGGMNEVLADLSADTGDERYLRLAARGFHHLAVLAPVLRGEDRLNGLHGNTQIPKVIGLACEYELTGDASYRTGAESFWDHVVNRRSYAIGGHGESEHFFPVEQFPQRLTPNTCETCNSYNMLKLTGHLFSWEPRAAQMDFIERTLCNHLAANIGQAPGEFGYFLGLGSVGVKAFSTPFDSWWCCVGTGLENPARYGEQIYFHGPDTLWINLFLASTLDWAAQGITLRQETAFPDGDTVRLILGCEHPTRMVLKIRHPYWCKRPDVKINGVNFDVNSSPSSYIEIDRTWRDGDTVDLTLPMELRWEPLPHSEGKIGAIMYGALVLAGIVPDEPGIVNPAKLRFSEHLHARGKTDASPPLFLAANSGDVLAHFSATGREFAEFRCHDVISPNDLTFVPFHRIYEEQYAVYFSRLTREEWTRQEGEIRAEREARLRREAATLDSITPGYQQPEIEHGLQSERSEVEDFSDRKCRVATDGGWFSYQMAVDPARPVTLIAAYWGGVWHKRQFDIWIDGETIASQELLTNKPGEFFEEAYPIPEKLTAGKAAVVVRFQSRPGDIAGGVFGLQTVLTDSAPGQGFDSSAIVFKDH